MDACLTDDKNPQTVRFRALPVHSEVEPWVDVNRQNRNNIVVIWQQDRWSDGGARGNIARVSFDGGSAGQTVPIPGVTTCTGGFWGRASDPWVSFGPDVTPIDFFQ